MVIHEQNGSHSEIAKSDCREVVRANNSKGRFTDFRPGLCVG